MTTAQRVERLRASDLRTPRTVEEAHAACAVCRVRLASIAERTASGVSAEEAVRAEAARELWSAKLAELEYVLARLLAGEAPGLDGLADRVARLERLAGVRS